MKPIRAVGIALVAAMLAPLASLAADAPAVPQLPVADFAKQPKFSAVKFSPDGKKFAALQLIKGRYNLTIGDLVGRKLTTVTSFTNYDVSSGYVWISNSRLVISLYDSTKGLAEGRGGGLFAVDADGGNDKELSPTRETCEARNSICRQTSFVRRVPGSEDEIIASANDRDAKTEDLYRLNTRTGKKVLLTEKNPGKVSRWVIDTKGIPRAAVSEDGPTLTQTFWYRDGADDPWRAISVTKEPAGRMEPAAFDTDGSLIVSSTLTDDKAKLYFFNPATGKPGALVLENPQVSIGANSIIAPVSLGFKVTGAFIDGDKPETAWFDPVYAKLQALMDASLPKGNYNQFNLLDDGKVAIASSSDRDPVHYFLYDPAKKQIEDVLQPYDWIKPEQMSPMTVVRYKARDGLEIPGYLTLPAGKPATKLPLVALIHGGPFGIRDEWGFQPDVQFLANRGYAVFQPNYRGSGGYGGKHYTLGFKQWGLTMQDDITDGVRYLIAKGVVDPNRICIAGGSYGGYATLMGLVKEPDLFKCGIDEAGVSDLFYFTELGYSDFNSNDPDSADAFFEMTLGDSSKDRVKLEATSPRYQAAKIKSPLMIVHAVRDQRVPFKHAEGMRDAMSAAGKSVEWVVYPDEGHGFIKYENRIDRYTKIEDFLKRNIGQ